MILAASQASAQIIVIADGFVLHRHRRMMDIRGQAVCLQPFKQRGKGLVIQVLIPIVGAQLNAVHPQLVDAAIQLCQLFRRSPGRNHAESHQPPPGASGKISHSVVEAAAQLQPHPLMQTGHLHDGPVKSGFIQRF